MDLLTPIVVAGALLLNTALTNKHNRKSERDRQSNQLQEDRERRDHEEMARLRQERLLAYRRFIAITQMIAGKQRISNEEFTERYADVEVLSSDRVRDAAKDLFNEAWEANQSRGKRRQYRLSQMKDNRQSFRQAIHSEMGWEGMEEL